MNDKKLFELCKQVYEVTGWKETDKFYAHLHNRIGESMGIGITDEPFELLAPLYTSDYLLEKLPKYLVWQGANSRLELVPQGYEYGGSAELWCATYAQPRHSIPILEIADTPLKALLKLTLTLYEAEKLNKSA